jgi:hypothetical protein
MKRRREATARRSPGLVAFHQNSIFADSTVLALSTSRSRLQPRLPFVPLVMCSKRAPKAADDAAVGLAFAKAKGSPVVKVAAALGGI